MKESHAYKLAQGTVIESTALSVTDKIKILRVLIKAEDAELMMEEYMAKKESEEAK
jgi:hypothetical protein